MKKILPLILLLSFSMPVVAQEFTLQCKEDRAANVVSFTDGNRFFRFDVDKGVVTDLDRREAYRVDTICPSSKADCSNAFISDSELGFRSYSWGKVDESLSISRIDGKYKYFIETEAGTSSNTGFCAPLKQAF